MTPSIGPPSRIPTLGHCAATRQTPLLPVASKHLGMDPSEHGRQVPQDQVVCGYVRLGLRRREREGCQRLERRWAGRRPCTYSFNLSRRDCEWGCVGQRRSGRRNSKAGEKGRSGLLGQRERRGIGRRWQRGEGEEERSYDEGRYGLGPDRLRCKSAFRPLSPCFPELRPLIGFGFDRRFE